MNLSVSSGLRSLRVSEKVLSRRYTSYGGKEFEKESLLKRWWNSWVPIPTGVGLTLLAILQWRRLEKERNKGRLTVAKNWEITCYKAIPLRVLSRGFGWISERYIPCAIRPTVYKTYAHIFGANLDEMAQGLESYDTLCSFFTRSLKNGVRPIQPQPIVSPADGTILNIGKLTSCQVDQVKGVTYSIKAFLGDVDWPSPNKREITNNEDWERYKKRLMKKEDNELYQCVVYLGPGDYHRFHSPANFNITFRRHFQGELLSVNPRIAAWIPGLFTLNERAVYTGSWDCGYFSMTAVGATNVGSIRVYDDKTLHTNERKWKGGVKHKEVYLKLDWRKGEEVGEFRMGSTIVLIWEGPKDMEVSHKPGDKVRVGQALVAPQGATTTTHPQPTSTSSARAIG